MQVSRRGKMALAVEQEREHLGPQSGKGTIVNTRISSAASLALWLLASLSPVTAQEGVAQEGVSKETNWPSFRGLNARGIADGYATPSAWNAEESKNVRWKTPIPGLGHSSPIVWGSRVFVTSAINGQKKAPLKVGLYGDGTPADDDEAQQWKVYCLDKKTGKILWERTAHQGVPRARRHPKATHANCTLATDGKNVVAFFGSEGLYCYDLNGKLRWKKDLGLLESVPYDAPSLQWGFASSPILYQNRVLVQCDVKTSPFLAALDIRDGHEIWRTPRDENSTWSTPTVYADGTHAQLIVNGYKHIGAYDVRTGKEVWRLTGGGDIPVPTPVVANGLIFIMNAHGKMSPIYAVRLDATGDISLQGDQQSNRGIAWSVNRGGAYMQTPMIYGDYLYSCQINGILNCYEAKTGKMLYQERLGTGRTGFTASPVAADGKLYFSSEEGDIYVVKAGPEFKILATNPMGEVCMATPAISEGTLFFRTQGHLVAIADTAKR
jgi:outer membrane protein assembly factor BamB